MALISLRELNDSHIEWITNRGRVYAEEQGSFERSLEGKVVGTFFTKSSTRTRTAFSAAALRLGAGLIAYGKDDLQLATGESLTDTGRVLATMVDALVVRTADNPGEMRALGANRGVPVINAMSSDEHPTQALSDLTFLRKHFGSLEGIRILYVGEGNNTASALGLALCRQRGAVVRFSTPPGYGLDPALLAWSTEQSRTAGSLIEERHDLDALPEAIDVVYTTRWQTTGTVKGDPDWRAVFEPFRVSTDLMRQFPGAIFMHDLPAHRGEEVDAEVLDGPCSVAFEQAAYKMFSAMAVLEWVLL
jgi:ornithine carbamoyltransferase